MKMKIKKVEIEGFRAYKYKNEGTFDFTNNEGTPSNFVAIYAPNGFGKSSFYDAVEWAITNNVDRLSGEYNRSNNYLAAKSTKEKNVAQKILRNIYVEKKIPTRVIVSTTTQEPFDRQLKKVRSDSNDLRTNNKKENEYFRRVILNQDEIDRFLREAKPQERYKRFMESFGDNTENIRQKLTILINDNKDILTQLQKQKDQLEAKISEPVDDSIFEQFNSLVSELNSDDENLPLIDGYFSVNIEHEILPILVTRAHELKVECEAREMKRQSLFEQLSRLSEVELNLRFIDEHQLELAKLNKGLLDSKRYQSLVDSYSECLNKLLIISQKLEALIEVKDLIEDFFQTKSKIAVITEKQSKTYKKYEAETDSFESLKQSAKEKNKYLIDADARSSFLRNALDNCNLIYSKILIHRKRSNILSSQVADKDLKLSLHQARYDTTEAELTKISSLDLNSQSLLISDLSSINFDKLKLQKLSTFSEELNIWMIHDKSINKTQNSLAAQMGLHERLTATGLQYLSSWPTSTCPLCHKTHQSETDLKEKVESTNLLSSLSKENMRKLELSAKRQNELVDKIDAIVREATKAQMQKLDELRVTLNELGMKIAEIKHEKSEIIAESQILEKQIENLYESVWGLTQKDFISRVEYELQELSTIRNEYLLQIAKLNQDISLKKALINEQHSSVKELNLQLEMMISNSAYKIVSAYLKENDLSSNELRTYCTEKLLKFKELEDKYMVEKSQIAFQYGSLHDVMLADGTWVEFSTLVSQKKNIEIEIAKSESFIEIFFESIGRIIGSQSNQTIDEIRNSILKAIDAQIQQYQTLNNKLEKIGLLSEVLKASKSYLNRLSLQETLESIDGKLVQRNQVDTALTTELKLVIGELEHLIKDFFYEDLIDSIYKKIDPHPSFKKVEFRADFTTSDNPGLNIVLSDITGKHISPMLFFSAAQLNVLSLSVFLASALYAKDDNGDPLNVIMIDDPIQSMDSINILAMIDLLRSISLRFDKQIIISTHDDNFFGLLQRKIPSEVLGSKFLRLEKFGVVVPVEPFANN